MKALASVVLVLAVCVSTVVPSSAADDKVLQNVRGDVSLDKGAGSPQALSPGASVSISDNDFAVTGGVVNNQPSQGAIALPDSTRILIGQNTRVQMRSFEQAANLTTANFILLNGRMRFRVQHPGGAKANYTFQTSTGQIAVRGTEGDIYTPAQGSLQVNVYNVTDPSLPVEVRLNDGRVFKLSAGQTLTVGLIGAAIAAGAAAGSQSATVTTTTQPQFNEFSEFGTPAESAAAAAAAGAAAAAASGGIPTIAAVAGGLAAIGGVIVGTVNHGGSSSSTGAVSVSPGSLTFTPGTGPLTFHASQDGFSGPFTASIDHPSVADVNTSSSDGTFTVTPKSNGTATITVTGANSSAAHVDVSVQATTIDVPSSLNFTGLNQSQNFQAHETYYAGGFTAKSGDTSVAKVTSPGSSSSSNGNFTVTSVGGGSTQIVVSDSLGHSAPVNVSVVPHPTPTPTSIPICIGAVGGIGDGTRHYMQPMMIAAPSAPHPLASPTCPPTPMAGPPIARPINPPVTRAPQPHPIGPQPPIMLPGVPGMPTPPPMPGNPPNGND